ncbi:MAG: hypothetical protein ACK5HR_00695 [Mycoplasmatales bacterium]
MENYVDVPVNIDNTILEVQDTNNHIAIDVEDKFNKDVSFGDLDLENIYKQIKKDIIIEDEKSLDDIIENKNSLNIDN